MSEQSEIRHLNIEQMRALAESRRVEIERLEKERDRWIDAATSANESALKAEAKVKDLWEILRRVQYAPDPRATARKALEDEQEAN